MHWLIVLLALVVALPAGAQDKPGRWERDAKTGCMIWTANPLPEQSVHWTGPCVDDKARGRGTATWSINKGNKEIITYYVGEMEDGKRNGKGSQFFADGARYSGEYVNNIPDGFGIYTAPDGARYEGKYRHGKKHGIGVKTWPNGDWYEGPFVDDKMQGRGVFHYKNGNRYEGPFVKGEMQGFGTAYYTNGNRYRGPFVHGKMDGIGSCLREDDTWAACEWKNGEFVRWVE